MTLKFVGRWQRKWGRGQGFIPRNYSFPPRGRKFFGAYSGPVRYSQFPVDDNLVGYWSNACALKCSPNSLASAG